MALRIEIHIVDTGDTLFGACIHLEPNFAVATRQMPHTFQYGGLIQQTAISDQADFNWVM